jgi:hypothetical protein
VCLAPDNLVQDIRAAVAADYPARSGMSCVFVYICYTHSTHIHTSVYICCTLHSIYISHLPLYMYAEDYSGRSGAVHATFGVHVSKPGAFQPHATSDVC